jgi:hypothetical protein
MTPLMPQAVLTSLCENSGTRKLGARRCGTKGCSSIVPLVFARVASAVPIFARLVGKTAPADWNPSSEAGTACMEAQGLSRPLGEKIEIIVTIKGE